MKTIIRDGLQVLHFWVKNFPLTAILFCSLFSSMVVAMGLQEHWLPALLIIHTLLLLLWIFVFSFQMRRLRRIGITLALACCFLIPISVKAQHYPPVLEHDYSNVYWFPPQGDFPPPPDQGGTGGGCLIPGIIVGVVVIVIGTTAGCQLVKFCQKHFPKEPPKKTNTNNIPPLTFELLNSVPAGPGASFDAAALNFGELGSCMPCFDGAGGSGNQDNTTTLTVTLQVQRGQLTMSDWRAEQGSDAVQDWRDFVNDTQQQKGVTVTGHAGDYSYSHNGVPVSASESPIRWDAPRQVVKIERGSPTYYTVIVEASKNLTDWYRIMATEVPNGFSLVVRDTNKDSTFIRARMAVSD